MLVTKSALLDDCLVYGGGASAAFLIEHLLAGGIPRGPLNTTGIARLLVERYAAGSATALMAVGIWALRRPDATAAEAVALHAAVLLMGGGTVAGAYWVREQMERGKADALRQQFQDEEHERFPTAVPNHRAA